MTRYYVKKTYLFIFALPTVNSSNILFPLLIIVSLVVLAYFCLLDTFIMADIFMHAIGRLLYALQHGHVFYMISTITNVTIYYQNCLSIRNKLFDLRLNLLNCNYDIVILTETWLREGICDGEIANDRYTVYRRDRSSSTSCKKDGGGVLIALKKSISSIRRSDWECQSVEEIILLLPTVGHDIVLTACYIPPFHLNIFTRSISASCCMLYQITTLSLLVIITYRILTGALTLNKVAIVSLVLHIILVICYPSLTSNKVTL